MKANQHMSSAACLLMSTSWKYLLQQ
jgi:hypothetical protein